jgi:hypothetical protein
MTEEQKAKAAANLAKARAARAEKRLAAEAFPAPVLAPAGEPPLPLEDPVDEQDEKPVELDDFGRFLAALDAETRDLLTDDELRVIYNEQTAKAKAEKRAAAKKAVADRALQHARVESGLMPTEAIEAARTRDRMAEMVRFTVDLPELGDYGLRIDQQIFLHGFTYTVTRAQYDTFAEIVWRNQQAELEFEGKGRGHWLRRRARGSVGAREEMAA